MARKANEANTNSPDDEDVKSAVANIEQCMADLATERGIYMQKCKRIHETKSEFYDIAGEKGISKKLLKLVVKERELSRKIDNLAVNLEPDERSELEMLVEKLGEFADTPLGRAAIAGVEGKATLAAVGA